MKLCTKCNKLVSKDNFRKQMASADGLICWCKECTKQYYIEQGNIKKEIPENKFCKKCRESKFSSDFCKDSHRKDGLRSYCKECDNTINREYFNKNKEKKLKQNREWGYKNKIRKNKKAQSPVLFNDKTKYRQEIEKYEEVKESTDGYLLIPCTYCGDWFKPSRQQISNRLNAIYGLSSGEIRLYCSELCKRACPTYRAKSTLKQEKGVSSREAQPQLRQLVFMRDEYTCQKCNKHKSMLSVPLHCHHIDPVINNPVESADVDNCITLCKYCHKLSHLIPDCKYHELKCL